MVGNSIVPTVYESCLIASTNHVVQIDGTSPLTEWGMGKSFCTCRVTIHQRKLQHSPKLLMTGLLCRSHKSRTYATSGLVLYLIIHIQKLLVLAKNLHQMLGIPAVCRQLLHQQKTSSHHTQCPRSHSSTPPYDPHRWLSLPPV